MFSISEFDNTFTEHNLSIIEEIASMNIPPLSVVKSQFQKASHKPLIWMRCHHLKYNNEHLKLKKNQIGGTVLSHLVADFDHDGIMKYVIDRIGFRDVIFHVVVRDFFF